MTSVLLDMAISLDGYVGGGIPLFVPGAAPVRLTKVRVVDAPNLTHLRYRVEPAAG